MFNRNGFLAALSLAVLVAGCSGPPARNAPSESTPAAAPVEQSARTPRLALSYDGGVLVLDAKTLEPAGDVPLEGFLRLNSAADGRHVLVSQSGGFAVLDLGTWTDDHGDHGHHYTATPRSTGMRFSGAEPGHAVAHDGKLTLFFDGTGAVDIVDPHALLAGKAEVASHFTVPAHHGVAVARGDGSVVVSRGDAHSRTGLEVRDAEGKPIAVNDECPGLHGEAAAADGVLTFGCQNGILIVRGNTIQKTASAEPYGRIGNQAGSAESPIVLGDYKTEAGAELERPQRFTLTDTQTGRIAVVPLDASYSFRSLDRGPRGEAIILGTDGALHVFDAKTAQRIARIGVIAPWQEPDDWHEPMPTVHVQGGTAYVSDPHARRLVAVDLANGSAVAETTLDRAVIEMTGVRG
ncbi:zinc metallochaperone AztD [Mycolicibacterium mucogenicum]|uniref:zinc metallochaperone AztD n=1 Tax=Mycolicibacterium mucogenicum TaxID=56689 RepID=UPI0039774294